MLRNISARKLPWKISISVSSCRCHKWSLEELYRFFSCFDVTIKEYCCKFDNSYLLCHKHFLWWKMWSGSLLPLLQAEAQSFSECRLEAIGFTVKCWNITMAEKFYSSFFVFTVKLQLQAEERGVVSIKGVSANRFLAMKEDGRLLALVSSGILMFISRCVLSVLVGPLLTLCYVFSPPAGLTQLLSVWFICATFVN